MAKKVKFSEAMTKAPRLAKAAKLNSELRSQLEGMNTPGRRGAVDAGGHNRPATRQGKRMIGAWFDPEIHETVNLACRALTINLQTFLTQALHEKLAKPQTQTAVRAFMARMANLGH